MKLLLVDDEIYVRRRILMKLDWETLGVTEVRDTDNGMEAIRMVETFSPDILLTDVRMPHIDGIQLAEKINQMKPDCKIIFISGYSDVPYLRGAIRLNAVSYIEKPVDIDELTGVLKKAIEAINRDQFIAKKLSDQQINDAAEIRAVIAKCLTQSKTVQTAVEGFNVICADRPCRSYVTMIVRLIGEGEKESIFRETALPLIYELFGDDTVIPVGFAQGDTAVVHLLLRSLNRYWRGKLEKSFQTFVERISPLHLTAVMSVGQVVSDPEGIPSSYVNAQTSLSRCFYKYGGCVCFHYMQESDPLDLENFQLSEFSHAIKEGSSKRAVEIVNALSAELRAHDTTPRVGVLRLFYMMLVCIYRMAKAENIEIVENNYNEYTFWDDLHQMYFLSELNAYLVQVISRYFDQLSGCTDNAVVNRTIRYIMKHYQDPDMSVATISSALQLTPTYLCHLFKSTTGDTLGSYITDFRIKKGLEYLESGKLRVKDVAQAVGYRSGDYFSCVFKKQLGYSPSGKAK